jgi:hypothetical protein
MLYTEPYTEEIKNIIIKGCIPEYYNEQLPNHEKIRNIFVNNKKRTGSCSSYTVPPKVHLTWIGSPLPDKYIPYVNSFVEHNKNTHDIYLWLSHDLSSSDLEKIPHVIVNNIHDLDLVHKDKIFKDPKSNYSRSNDILSYELIFLFGGIYCDIDTMCIKHLDENNFGHSLLTYIDHTYFNIQHAFFAFPKNSEFLEYLISCIDVCYNEVNYPYSVGPGFITTGCHAFDDERIRMIKQKFIGSDGSDHSAVFLQHKLHANWLK